MPVDRETVQRWEKLAQGANEVFAGQPMEDVGGALALLTAMLLAGAMQDEEGISAQRVVWMTAQHGKLVMELLPAFLETIEEQGGWEKVHKEGRH